MARRGKAPVSAGEILRGDYLARRNRHRGHAGDDANQSDPGRRGQGLAEERGADGDADRHAQIGLRRGADRAEGLDQAEIDHEGKRG